MLLNELQKDFIHSISNANGDNNYFLQQLQYGKLSAETQLNIYQRNYTGAIQKTLQQIYPACRNILGDDYFHTLCHDYYKRHPSNDSNLNYYGKHFNNLLLSHCKTNEQLNGYEYLHDLAILEWHWHASYYTADDVMFDFEAFSKITDKQQSNLIFKLSHSLTIHSSNYPIIDIWKDNTADTASGNTYSLPPGNIMFCIYREKFTPSIELIDDNLCQIITAIQNNKDLDSLCHSDGFDINEVLPYLIQKGWVTGFKFKDNAC